MAHDVTLLDPGTGIKAFSSFKFTRLYIYIPAFLKLNTTSLNICEYQCSLCSLVYMCLLSHPAIGAEERGSIGAFQEPTELLSSNFASQLQRPLQHSIKPSRPHPHPTERHIYTPKQ